MAPVPPGSRPAEQTLLQRKVQGARRQLADPLTRNGYALIANSGATGALGLVYWLLVARLYPTAEVGRATAAYAAMNLLAGFTALNFNGALDPVHPPGRPADPNLHHPRLCRQRSRLGRGTILFLLTTSWWGSSYARTRAARSSA